MDEMTLFWNELLKELKHKLDDNTFNTWIKPSYPLRLDHETISIGVPNTLTKNFLTKNVSNLIRSYSIEHYGIEYRPIFTVGAKNSKKHIQNNEHHIHSVSLMNKAPTIIENADSYNQTYYPLNPNYTFENFVAGKGNELAYSTAYSIAEKPGITYNPVLFFGGSGLGKTHLMQAIGNECKRLNPSLKVKYATSESFINDFVKSIQTKSQEEFREMYRTVDVLLIDDVQFLANKNSTQEEFFHTFNALYQNNKQIVLTCDRHPKEINVEERLITRFEWGLPLDLVPPDLETRIAILHKKAISKQIDIDSNTLLYIASNIDSNVRELEGALSRVHAYSALMSQDISVNLAAEALKINNKSNNDIQLTLNTVMKEVAKFYRTSIEELKGTKRTKEIATARQTAMYLCRELLDISFQKIGEDFGNKNHTTVMHAYTKISELIISDTKIKQEVEQIKQKLSKG